MTGTPLRPPGIPPSSPAGTGRFLTAALYAYVGVEAVTFLTNVVTLLRWREREQELFSPEPFFTDGWELGLGLAYFGVFLLCGVAWLIWQFQAHSNLSRLTRTRFKAGAAFWIFVPVVSLFLPYQAIGELARAGTDRPALRRWWWGLYLAMNLTIGAASVVTLLQQWQLSILLRAIGSILAIGAAIAAIRLVAVINKALEERRSGAGWPAVSGVALLSRTGMVWTAIAAIVTIGAGAGFGVVLPQVVRNLPSVPETDFEFAVGGCFDETDVDFVEANCSEPHEAEVYRIIDHPEATVYPGPKLIAGWAEPQCYAGFESYVGLPYQDSALEFGYLYPTAQGWQAGDREVVCYLFDPSGDALTDSIAQPTA
jgi:hypothetical protein